MNAGRPAMGMQSHAALRAPSSPVVTAMKRVGTFRAALPRQLRDGPRL